MTDNAIVRAENVVRRYGRKGASGFDAVRGVSFSVRRGEVFALLGTNGAGKTSTLEVVEGLARPTAGTVRVLGHDPCRDRRQVRPRIAIMLQEGGFPADLTVLETARLWAGTLNDARPAAEVLELIDLSHRSGVTVKQLSGGERRRLDLGLALLGRPEVLFLDEPTAGLDPESRRRTWQLIRDHVNGGTTVVLTTHYLEEVEQLADRLAIMHRGQVARAGTVAELVSAQPSTITFALPADSEVQLPELPGAVSTARTARPLGDHVVVQSDDLTRTIAALSAWGESRALTLERLAARPASLEEVFLAVADSDGLRATRDTDLEHGLPRRSDGGPAYQPGNGPGDHQTEVAA